MSTCRQPMEPALPKSIGFAALLAAAPTAALAEELWPTPEIREIVKLEAPHTVAYAMRGELGTSGTLVGLGLACTMRGPRKVRATAFFGSLPADRRPVQVAVRGADGRVERFGRVVSAGPESGFHSPRFIEPGEAGRLAEAALRPGALVSNGYRSFWNRASEERNREARETFMGCLRSKRP